MRWFAGIFAIGLAVLAGCGDEQKPKPADSGKQTMGEKLKEDAEKAGETIKEDTKKAGETIKEDASKAGDKLKDAVTPAKPDAPTPDAPTPDAPKPADGSK